ncbi:hypothetical protein AAZX31_03G016800 [Glycine max]
MVLINILVACDLLWRRPGVLVLVNDCDWELSGQLNTSLEDKDVVVFISTLHGG